MKTKVCRKCFKEKKTSDFYERNVNSDKLSSYCRPCTRKLTLDWRKKYPFKRSAHQAVATALRNGDLKKPKKCQRCKRELNVIAHHADYSQPLNVEWICDLCHMKLHANRMYRARILGRVAPTNEKKGE